MDVRRVLHQTCLSFLVFIAWVSQASLGYAGQLCTKKVKDERPQQQKKVAMIRRIPASCSNWDRSWSWITNEDCGTKYKREYVSLPNQMVTYRLQYVCCDNDDACLNGWFGSEERLMAIIIGTAVAVLVILVIIFVLSYLHRRGKLRCINRSEDNNHIYETADYETVDGTPPQYEEICPKKKLDEKYLHDDSPEAKSALTPEKLDSSEKCAEGSTRLENTYVPFITNSPTTPSAPFLDEIYSKPNNVNNKENNTLLKKSADEKDGERQENSELIDSSYINEDSCKDTSSDQNMTCTANTGAKDDIVTKVTKVQEPNRNNHLHLELTNSQVSSPSEKSNHSYEILTSPNSNGTISNEEI